MHACQLSLTFASGWQLSPEGVHSTAWSDPTLQTLVAEIDQWSRPFTFSLAITDNA